VSTSLHLRIRVPGNFVFEQGGCAIICPPLNHLAGHETCCRTWCCHVIAELARLRLRRASQQVAAKVCRRRAGIEVRAFTIDVGLRRRSPRDCGRGTPETIGAFMTEPFYRQFVIDPANSRTLD
jgi:hypothetical protein